MKKRLFSVLTTVAVLLLVLAGGARAQGPVAQGDVDAQSPLGTGFTYQGRLTDGGTPAEGKYDLRFALYDAPSGGAQVGNTIYREDVEVADGYFIVALDYGGAAFTGQARYLEVGVRPGESSDAYTTLSPRQALTAAPYALHASSAPWAGLTGVPADLADGDDDTTYSAGTGLTLVGTQFGADTAYLQRRVSATCAVGSSIRAIGADGTVTCETDDGRAYTAGAGLRLSGSEFSADTAYLQRRVSATCAVGSSIRAIGADGTVTCEADDGQAYTAGAGLNLSGNQFSVRFAGSGSASTVSRSDHNHLGQTWTGSNNPLVIRGDFQDAQDRAALVVLSVSGDGLNLSAVRGVGLRVKTAMLGIAIISAADGGIYVGDTYGSGLHIGLAYHGVYVERAEADGVYVERAGWPSTTNSSTSENGFEVAGAEGDGLYVGRADQSGVYVHSAADDGVYVKSAGSPSTTIPSDRKNGFEVAGAQWYGLYVGRGDVDGVHIDSAGLTGVYVRSAGERGVTVNSAGIDGVVVNSAGRYAGNFNGNVRVTGSLSKGGGSFEIDHPLDPENKTLRHSFVESPDMMNVYNGNVTTDEEGYATVRLPDYFEALNTDYRYQLTAIGVFAQAIVAQEVADNQFVIRTDQPNVKVSWQVTGIRRDPWAEANRVVVEEDKPPEEQGTYLHPGAYGLPETRGLAYREALEQGIEPPQEAE